MLRLSFRCYLLLLLGLLLAGCAAGKKSIEVSPADAADSQIPPVANNPIVPTPTPTPTPPVTGGDDDDVVVGDEDVCEVEGDDAYGTLKKDKDECECEGNQGNGKGKGKCKKEEDDSE